MAFRGGSAGCDSVIITTTAATRTYNLFYHALHSFRISSLISAMKTANISSDVLLEILKKLRASDVLTVRLVASSLFQSTHCAVSNDFVDLQVSGDIDTY